MSVLPSVQVAVAVGQDNAGSALVHANDEADRVARLLDPCRSCRVLRTLHHTRLDKLQEAFAEHRGIVLFHYAGHAARAGLLLGDGVAHVEGMVPLLRRQQLRLVFLNACLTAGIARALSDGEGGVPLVIGTTAKIADDDAVLFAECFYRQLGAGATPRHAFEHAHDNHRAKHGAPHPRDLMPADDAPAGGEEHPLWLLLEGDDASIADRPFFGDIYDEVVVSALTDLFDRGLLSPSDFAGRLAHRHAELGALAQALPRQWAEAAARVIVDRVVATHGQVPEWLWSEIGEALASARSETSSRPPRLREYTTRLHVRDPASFDAWLGRHRRERWYFPAAALLAATALALGAATRLLAGSDWVLITRPAVWALIVAVLILLLLMPNTTHTTLRIGDDDAADADPQVVDIFNRWRVLPHDVQTHLFVNRDHRAVSFHPRLAVFSFHAGAGDVVVTATMTIFGNIKHQLFLNGEPQ